MADLSGARIESETLTDGSIAYNVEWPLEGGLVTFAAVDERAAVAIIHSLDDMIQLGWAVEVKVHVD